MCPPYKNGVEYTNTFLYSRIFKHTLTDKKLELKEEVRGAIRECPSFYWAFQSFKGGDLL